MSRLTEIIENHEQLDRLNSVLKHYGVNAEFVTACVMEQFEKKQEQDPNLLEDLKLLYATF